MVALLQCYLRLTTTIRVFESIAIAEATLRVPVYTLGLRLGCITGFTRRCAMLTPYGDMPLLNEEQSDWTRGGRVCGV